MSKKYLTSLGVVVVIAVIIFITRTVLQVSVAHACPADEVGCDGYIPPDSGAGTGTGVAAPGRTDLCATATSQSEADLYGCSSWTPPADYGNAGATPAAAAAAFPQGSPTPIGASTLGSTVPSGSLLPVGSALPASNSSFCITYPTDPACIRSNTGVTPAADNNSGRTPAAPGNAGATPAAGGVQTLSNPLTANSVGDLVKSFAMIFSYIVVLFAVLALVWTGLQFITAQGKPDKLTELKSKLLYIVIGVAIVIGARIIINVVINTLSASGVVNSQIIQHAKDAVTNQ